MRILDKYIGNRIILSYFTLLLSFVGLHFIVDTFSHLSDYLRVKPPLYIIGSYYIYMLPLIFLRVSPFSLLIAALYTYGELNKNNEIITMRASGISIIKISFPLIFFTLIISFFTFFIQEKVLIYSQKKVDDINLRFIKGSGFLPSEERNLAFSSKNMIIFIQKFLPREGKLEDVTIFKENEAGAIDEKIACRSIIFKDKTWQGREVTSYKIGSDGEIEGMPRHWKNKGIDLEEKPHELIYKRSIFAQFRSLKNLKKEIKHLRKIKSHSLLLSLIVDYNHKLAIPFSHLFLIIGIIPFALEIKERKVALSSLAMGFIFGFVYYTLDSFSIALGKTGIILPVLSAWVAPIFFLAVGLTGILIIK